MASGWEYPASGPGSAGGERRTVSGQGPRRSAPGPRWIQGRRYWEGGQVLHSIESDRIADPERLEARTKLVRVVRPAFGRGGWVGRHDNDASTPDRTFGGRIEEAKRAWSVLGIEALGLD
jgi:hypothetical protein